MAEEQFTDSGKLLKMEVDYSDTVDEKIPQCQQMARVRFTLCFFITVAFINHLFFNNRKGNCKKLWTS